MEVPPNFDMILLFMLGEANKIFAALASANAPVTPWVWHKLCSVEWQSPDPTGFELGVKKRNSYRGVNEIVGSIQKSGT
jgi:hypothetical protein